MTSWCARDGFQQLCHTDISQDGQGSQKHEELFVNLALFSSRNFTSGPRTTTDVFEPTSQSPHITFYVPVFAYILCIREFN